MLDAINSFAQDMYNYEQLTVTNILIHILIFLGAFFTIKYHWNRRYLYYYASKIPGPLSLPFIGSAQLFLLQQDNFFKVLTNIVQSHPTVGKFWLGPNLYVATSLPQDIEIVLTTFLEKSPFYSFLTITKNALLAAPVKLWKGHRRIINHCFHSKIIDSFAEIFARNSKNLVKVLDDGCGKEETDLFSKIWSCTIDIGLETIYDLSPTVIKDLKDIMPLLVKLEKILIQRLHTIWLYLEPLWQLSALGKEYRDVENRLNAFATEAVDYKTNNFSISKLKDFDDFEMRKKWLCNYLISILPEKGTMTRDEIKEEASLIFVAAHETTAISVTYVMLTLGLYPDVQEKVYQELVSIFGDDDRDPTLEDVKKMEYLERVIKETMRLLPVVPFILRSADKTIQLESCVLPAGCDVLISIMSVHKSPELWPNPLKFDPDRFLPEEVAKRHRCAYIPFSFGVRNCLGFQYGMVSMKHIVAAIVKSFQIKTLNCKSMEDIELEFHVMTKPKNYRVLLEKRGK